MKKRLKEVEGSYFDGKEAVKKRQDENCFSNEEKKAVRVPMFKK
ncbi:MAG: hypothetical protein WC435_02485 [Candidatus Paceibacterota bacterium]